jgi:hypothetical protein
MFERKLIGWCALVEIYSQPETMQDGLVTWLLKDLNFKTLEMSFLRFIYGFAAAITQLRAIKAFYRSGRNIFLPKIRWKLKASNDATEDSIHFMKEQTPAGQGFMNFSLSKK